MLDRLPLIHLLFLCVAALLVTYAVFLGALWGFPGRLSGFRALLLLFGALAAVPAVVLSISSVLVDDRPVAGLIRRRWLALAITFGLTYTTFFGIMWTELPEQMDTSHLDTMSTLELLAAPDLEHEPRGMKLPREFKLQRRSALEGAWIFSGAVFGLGVGVAQFLDYRWARAALDRARLGRL